MTTEMLTLRVTSEQKTKLEAVANQRGCTVSDVLRSFIDSLDRQQITIEIPAGYAETVALCAELAGQGVPEFVRKYFTDLLRDLIGDECGYLIEERIKTLLGERPMTKDEIAARLPEVIREDADYYLKREVCHERIERILDSKYQLKMK